MAISTRLLTTLAMLTLMANTGLAAVSAWMPFEIDQGNILVPVTVGGIEAKAILDSGERMYMINERFIAKHSPGLHSGAQYDMDTQRGTELRTSYNDVRLNLFGADLQLDQLVSVDLGQPEIAVLIGARFFEQFVFQIDYPNSRMRLIEFESIDLRKSKNINAKVDESTGLPIVKVELNGEKNAWLVLDTSDVSGLTLNRVLATGDGWVERYNATVEERGLDEIDAGFTEVRRGVAATGTYELFRLPKIQFGPYEVENVLTYVPAAGDLVRLQTETKRAFSHIKSKRIKGLVGYDVLRHFVVTIDYRRAHIHIGLPET